MDLAGIVQPGGKDSEADQVPVQEFLGISTAKIVHPGGAPSGENSKNDEVALQELLESNHYLSGKGDEVPRYNYLEACGQPPCVVVVVSVILRSNLQSGNVELVLIYPCDVN